MKSKYFQADSNIELSFQSAITAGRGNIVISNGSDTRTIAVNDRSQVTFSKYGDTVTIDPKKDLIPNTSYSVQIASGVLMDIAGNSYAGISNATPFNFTTIDSDPRLINTNLLDDAAEFQIDGNIKLSFNEVVKAGSGNIVISNGSDIRTIAVNDSSQVTFSKFGSTVTINPKADLIPSTSYSIQMPKGVFTDMAGHAYAGISDTNSLNFTAIDSGPRLFGSNLSFNASEFKTNDNIKLSFNEPVKAGSGDIVISNGSDIRSIAVNDSSQVTFSKFGGTVAINPAKDLIPNTTYSIQMASGVISDLAGNGYDGEIRIVGTVTVDSDVAVNTIPFV